MVVVVVVTSCANTTSKPYTVPLYSVLLSTMLSPHTPAVMHPSSCDNGCDVRMSCDDGNDAVPLGEKHSRSSSCTRRDGGLATSTALCPEGHVTVSVRSNGSGW